MMRFAVAFCILVGAVQSAFAWQPIPDRYGYARYPSYYGNGYYRAPYFGGGMPYRPEGYYHDRPSYRYAQPAPAYRYAPRPSYNYNWRAFNGGRPFHEDWQHGGW